MSVETIEPARAEEFEQAQGGRERRVMGHHHGLTNQVEAILSRHRDTSSIHWGHLSHILDDARNGLPAPLLHALRPAGQGHEVLVLVGLERQSVARARNAPV